MTKKQSTLDLTRETDEVKMKKFLFVCSFILGIGLHDILLASGEYPVLRMIHVKVSVRFDRAQSYFYYSYELSNDPSNSGKIEELRIDISCPLNTIESDTVGLRFDTSNGDYEERSFRRNYPRLRGKIIPVSPFILPEKWGTSWGNDASISINNVFDPVAPGKTVSGIVIMSRGLPAIRWIIVEPEFQDGLIFSSIQDTSWKVNPIHFIDSIRGISNYRGVTIAPSSPPNPFIPLAFADTLLSYHRQSVQLDWLKEKKGEKDDDAITLKTMENQLQNIRTSISRKETSRAKSRLTDYLKTVETVWKASQPKKKGDDGVQDEDEDVMVVMTSEAYALLKYNGEYLLSKL
jgi:hypothetical protein